MWWFHGARTLVTWALSSGALPPGPVLDAGCGTGGMLPLLAQGTPGRLLIGLDQAPAALDHAARRGIGCLARGTVNSLPFADASLAAIISADILGQRDVDPRAALAESARCLIPGGILILNLPAYDWMRSMHDRRVYNDRRFVRRDIAALLGQTGLRLRRATHWNAILLPALVLWRLAAPTSSSDVKPYPRWLNQLLQRVLGVERRLIRHGVDLPLGSSILAVVEKP